MSYDDTYYYIDSYFNEIAEYDLIELLPEDCNIYICPNCGYKSIDQIDDYIICQNCEYEYDSVEGECPYKIDTCNKYIDQDINGCDEEEYSCSLDYCDGCFQNVNCFCNKSINNTVFYNSALPINFMLHDQLISRNAKDNYELKKININNQNQRNEQKKDMTFKEKKQTVSGSSTQQHEFGNRDICINCGMSKTYSEGFHKYRCSAYTASVSTTKLHSTTSKEEKQNVSASSTQQHEFSNRDICIQATNDEIKTPLLKERALALAADRLDNKEKRIEMTKLERIEMYQSYLAEEGYVPKISEDKEFILFKFEGMACVIFIDEDEGFFRVLSPGFWTIESDEEREKAIHVAHNVNISTKVANVFPLGESASATIEMFCYPPEVFKAVFQRSLNALKAVVVKFVEEMQK
ncbi:MAG: hypothetical protein WCP97_09185 [bacterium]